MSNLTSGHLTGTESEKAKGTVVSFALSPPTLNAGKIIFSRCFINVVVCLFTCTGVVPRGFQLGHTTQQHMNRAVSAPKCLQSKGRIRISLKSMAKLPCCNETANGCKGQTMQACGSSEMAVVSSNQLPARSLSTILCPHTNI